MVVYHIQAQMHYKPYTDIIRNNWVIRMHLHDQVVAQEDQEWVDLKVSVNRLDQKCQLIQRCQPLIFQ